jgi:tetratricopeptide (TPR) repeat protein
VASKEQVLDILRLGSETERAFGEGLSEAQRETCGTYEQWCAKDVLAHIAFWKERMAGRVTAAARGESLERMEDYEQVNAACFAAHQHESWKQVWAYATEAHQALVAATEALSEAQLNDPTLMPQQGGRLPWRLVVGTGYTHAMTHLASYYAAHDQPGLAIQLQERANAELAELDDSPEWRGGLLYNMACVHALAGQLDEAVEELRQALTLHPGLTEWSKEDSDLASLRDRADYQELYAPSAPPES